MDKEHVRSWFFQELDKIWAKLVIIGIIGLVVFIFRCYYEKKQMDKNEFKQEKMIGQLLPQRSILIDVF